MNSKKRNNNIQKSVEDSILDAVTRLQNDEASFNPFAGVRKRSDTPTGNQDKAAELLWEKLQKAEKAEKVERPTPNENRKKESKTFVAPSKQLNETMASPPAKPPVKEKMPFEKPAIEAAPPSFHFEGPSLGNLNSIQLKLYEGDHLKIAQQKIEDLERDLERLRLENERLASAAELFQKRSEDSLRAKQEIEKKHHENEERFTEERSSLKSHLAQRDQLISELREKVEDLEARLSSDIRKSRSRERELENRLELARMEKLSLVGSKDEIILDLKRQVDQLNHEIGNYRRKNADMNQTIEANQEQFRRTVRALRLALTNLEVNEQIGGRSKKAE